MKDNENLIENLEMAFQANISYTDLNELYVDTGDFDKILNKLSKPNTFLVHGQRGSGKTLLVE